MGSDVAYFEHRRSADCFSVRCGWMRRVRGQSGRRAMSTRLIDRARGRRRPPVGWAGLLLARSSRGVCSGVLCRRVGGAGIEVVESLSLGARSRSGSSRSDLFSLPGSWLVSFWAGPTLGPSSLVRCVSRRGVEPICQCRWLGGSDRRSGGSRALRARLAVELQIDHCPPGRFYRFSRYPGGAGAGLSRCRAGARCAGRRPGGGCRQRLVR